MKEIKVEWCEAFILGQFTKHHLFPLVGGIEINCFFDSAEKAGLWVRGTYGSPMSIALDKLCKVESVCDGDGNFCYNIFKLKPSVYTAPASKGGV